MAIGDDRQEILVRYSRNETASIYPNNKTTNMTAHGRPIFLIPDQPPSYFQHRRSKGRSSEINRQMQTRSITTVRPNRSFNSLNRLISSRNLSIRTAYSSNPSG